MNEIVVKRASIFALIFGALIGLFSLIPQIIGVSLFVLAVFSSVAVILYMKKNDKHLGIMDNQQSAMLGALIGFFATIGFFASFSPMVAVLHLLFKNYYSYAIPYFLNDALWLFFVIIFTVALIFSAINATSAMGLNLIFNQIENKPQGYDAPLDIQVED